MTNIEINQFIRDTCKNSIFNYSESALKKIIKSCNHWGKNWAYIFKRILARIKHGDGGYRTENGKKISLPINSQKYMSIFYKRQPSGRYLIYDFEVNDFMIGWSLYKPKVDKPKIDGSANKDYLYIEFIDETKRIYVNSYIDSHDKII